MAVSKIEICNIALTRLGFPAIASLDERSNEARYCSKLYDSAVTSVLRDHHWNFASKRVRPAAVPKPEEFVEYTYLYEVPVDCIRVKSILNASGDECSFSLESYMDSGYSFKGVATNEPEPVMVYTKEVTDVRLFDAGFVEALTFRLAADLAWPLVREHEAESSMLQKYAAALPSAMSTDSQEGKREPEPEDTWISSRRS